MGDKHVSNIAHKNPFRPKVDEPLQSGNQFNKPCYEKLRHSRFILFPIITACTFVGYWFVLCPLLFYSLHDESRPHSEKKSTFWPLLYWLTALVTWLIPMLILIVIWKKLNNKYTEYAKPQTSDSEDFTALPYVHSLRRISESVETNPSEKNTAETDSSDRPSSTIAETKDKAKESRDLPTLVIHRHMSGNGVENTGTVNVDKTDSSENDQELLSSGAKQSEDMSRGSMKNCLKLSITPPEDEENDKELSKELLSPRELFFIDLIREANKISEIKEHNEYQPLDRKLLVYEDFSDITESCKKSEEELEIPSETDST